jgi:photosystem II stability/assembly factor-like uncharacterized protein
MLRRELPAAIFLLCLSGIAHAQLDPKLYQDLRWRMIGPFRGGRTVGATGAPSKPGVFYIGVNNGGVWRTNDYGHTWNPIFDDQPTGSIGALAVAPSDPNVIYVGSGEGLQRPDLSVGNGVYRSRDEGKTWTHLGLRNGQQIAAVLVDPRDANRIFVSVLGHPYGPNPERGIYRSTDGGDTFQQVLYKGPDTGGMAMSFDPHNPDVVYADLFEARQGPWENGTWEGPGSGLYKSIDGGTTWNRLEGGLPGEKEHLGRIGFAVAPSDSKRIYALADAATNGGLYRSDDGGTSWKLVDKDHRIWGRGDDFAEVRVDPKNEDVLYSANTSTYKSTDGGHNFVPWKGSPGGDDYHTVYIDPNNSQIILLAGDQGAAVSVNGGETWGSWYNQPTAQMYHVATDNRFPYWVYSGQQESGSAGVASRGPMGRITFREWHPVAAEEYAYVAPDPLHPGVVFGGNVSRYDEATGQAQNVSPIMGRGPEVRFLRTKPLLFSTVDKHALYLGGNIMFKTVDEGQNWKVISPDLSRESAPPPAGSVFQIKGRRGVIYAIGLSYQKADTIWAGTDDGLVWRTEDGGAHWSNITPTGLTAWSKIAQVDPGRFDNDTAYVAVNRIRLDDLHPHIYRTHDGGMSWVETVRGLPDDGPVNVVREDPVRKGLLYAGTEQAVFVSFDDGDNWQPLRLNMPATSIRDLVVHEDDLVIATHGRSFWILDDVTPLRQAFSPTATADSVLFQPQTAVRVRWNTNSDTPLPPDEPAGENPPDEAILDYFLGKPASSVSLEILDSSGRVVNKYSSTDMPKEVEEDQVDVPFYWFKPPTHLSVEPGHHRWMWDIRFAALPGTGRDFTMEAVEHETPTGSPGPWCLPGKYTARLTVDGRVQTKTFTVVMDPRVKTPSAGLQAQYDVAVGCYDLVLKLHGKGAAAEALTGQLEGLEREVSSADAAPTTVQQSAFKDLQRKAQALITK